jgi:hypothetical protein
MKRVRVDNLTATALPLAFQQLDSSARDRAYKKITRRHLGLCAESVKYFPSYARLILKACGPMDYITWVRVKQIWHGLMANVACGWLCPGFYQMPSQVHLLTAPGDVKVHSSWTIAISEFNIETFMCAGPYNDETERRPCGRDEFMARMHAIGIVPTIDGCPLNSVLGCTLAQD